MRQALLLFALSCLAACADPEEARLKATTKPTYDKATGKLKELTFDSNKNGTIDTWTVMDGTRPILARLDRDEDGQVDRWEYYDAAGQLLKVGFSRKNDGKPDAWAFSGPGGSIERVEISSTADDARIDRREYYDATGLVRAEDDTNADGAADKWETYQAGEVATASFDENGDGRPDRRLTYSGGALILIETGPGPGGHFTKRVDVK